MKKLITLFMLISFPVFAEDLPKEITLTVSPEELNFIGQALDNMPYGKTSVLINKLHNQINEQIKSKTPEPVKK